MSSQKFIQLRSCEGRNGTAYLELRDHPHELVFGVTARSVDLPSLIDGYDGPSLTLDFDKSGRAIGIEILYPSDGDEEELDEEESGAAQNKSK